LIREHLRTLRPAWAPLAILVAATLAAWVGPPLPPSLAGLATFGPYVVLAAAAAVCWWFNRGRAFVLALSVLAAYAGWRHAPGWDAGSVTVQAVYTAAALLVPLNALLALALPERGARYIGIWRWLALIALEALALAWIAAAGRSELSGEAWRGALGHWLLRSPPTPLLARLAFAAAFAAAVARAWPMLREAQLAPLEIGFAGALALFFIACEWAGAPQTFAIFIAAAGASLLVGVLQESHRMAFRDALTGLANRRALEEALRALGPRYAIAMVDVDHFKAFNDLHGHDIGDQVLKLVAAQLALVGGGGRAFRYGGEEFAVLFPDHDLERALPHLEAVRGAIERYPMAVRGESRPRDREEGTRHRGSGQPEKTLSVTVSIGAAEARGAAAPAQVLKAADEALYRAKQGGRNRVSR
jgi:diguanylate cyclase (GGDEF)-like protein